jgi:Na+-translocating ferredoxin:NAD+ oxidoreductase RnfC subunit
VKLAGLADSVLLNVAECEPLLHKDKEVLSAYPDEVIAGLRMAMERVGAGHASIGIKEKYHHVIELIEPKLPPDMSVVPLRDAYPAGDEFILVYDVLGRVIPPGGIPLQVAAVVLNVESALNVAHAAGRPVTEKSLTIAGAVHEPVTLRVPVGQTLRECVDAAGGPTIDEPHDLVGWAMMGRLEDNHDELVDKTTGGVIVFPCDHVLVRLRRQEWTEIARIGPSACGQRSVCAELCPRWLLGHPTEPHKAMRSLGFNRVGDANVPARPES